MKARIKGFLQRYSREQAIMAEMVFSTERELMDRLVDSAHYRRFRTEFLPHKIEREARAWGMLKQFQGRCTRELLDSIFDTVDIDPKGKRWFGPMLAAPNRGLIFESSIGDISRWIDELLFKDHSAQEALDICLGQQKLKGASRGLATLLLYLSDSRKYNIWVPPTDKGLVVLGRMNKKKGKDQAARYARFNKAAIAFRTDHGLEPATVDWFLSVIGLHVVREQDHFLVDGDFVGGEITPTNEDGVTTPNVSGVRYWKIAPGGKAWNWEACLRGGFIAIGWDELGDLSEMNRTQFENRAKQLAAQHDDWTLRGMEQAWKFCQIREGDGIIANRGTTEILGIGTVCGQYEYSDVESHCHHLPVNWKDHRRREVNQPGWRRTLIELSREKFEEIRGPMAPDSPSINPPYELETCAK